MDVDGGDFRLGQVEVAEPSQLALPLGDDEPVFGVTDWVRRFLLGRPRLDLGIVVGVRPERADRCLMEVEDRLRLVGLGGRTSTTVLGSDMPTASLGFPPRHPQPRA